MVLIKISVFKGDKTRLGSTGPKVEPIGPIVHSSWQERKAAASYKEGISWLERGATTGCKRTVQVAELR